MNVQTQTVNPRLQRGYEIVEKGKITQLDKSTFLVPSQSKEGRYKVERIGEGFVCECPDFQFRAHLISECKHIYAVKLWLELKAKAEVRAVSLKTPEAYECKFCGSNAIIHYGRRGRKQAYLCKECRRVFVVDDAFRYMKFDPQVITMTLDLYYKGVSLRAIQDHLNQIFGVRLSHQTVENWIRKYLNLIAEYVKTLKPTVGGQWHADEMMVKAGGDWKYLWNVMDKDTRFLLASQITKGRDTDDASSLFAKAKEIAKTIPKTVVTDGLSSYQGAWLNEFCENGKPRPEHVRKISFDNKIHNNNLIERLHGTKRDRTKVMRGLKTEKTPILPMQDIYYNFIRPHQALEGKTPAEKAGVELNLNGNKWLGLIKKAT
jgi:transposase-like protein